MKFIVLAAFFSLTSYAQTSSTKTYSKSVTVEVSSPESSCVGSFNQATQMCEYKGAEKLEITTTKKGTSVHLYTVSTSGQSCEYDGKEVVVTNDKLAFIDESETCVVKVTIEKNVAKTNTYGRCLEHCGVGATLETSGLKLNK